MTTTGLLPKVERLKNALIEACAAQGITIAITEAYRSIERQNQLYAQGRTTPGKIVTNAKGGQSYHNWKVAFDIIFVQNGKRTYTGDWEKVGKIGESLGLEWGGRWKSFTDKPHFQFTGGYSIQSFAQNKVDYSKFQ